MTIQDNTTSLVEHALDWARHGVPVGPMSSRNKGSGLPGNNGDGAHWLNTTDSDQILHWLTGQYAYAPGVTGRVPDGKLVIDLDPKNNPTAATRAAFDALPETRTTYSGRGDGGAHKWYRYTGKTLSTPRGTAVDVLRPGANVVLSGSIHPDTGGLYTHTGDDIADLTEDQFLAFVSAVAASAPANSDTNITSLFGRLGLERLWDGDPYAFGEPIQHGEQHHAGVTCAGTFLGVLPYDDAEEMFWRRFEDTDDHDEDDWTRTWKWVADKQEKGDGFVKPVEPITPADVMPSIPVYEPIPIIPDDGRSAEGALAVRFANDAADRLVLTTELGWLWYDGRRWVEDTRGASSKQYQRSLKARLQDIAKITDSDVRKRLFVETTRLDRNSGRAATMDYAGQTYLLHPLDDFDADPYLLNTSTGVVDLRTGAVQPHHPRLRMLKMARGGYTDGITPARPTWDAFAQQVLPDPEVRGFVQRLLGYALVGSVTEHVLPVFYGSGGGGKSTLVEAVSWALGDYANPCSADMLLGATSAGGTEGVDLFGTRFAPASETDEGKRLAAGTVKKLTGGDTMKARRLYRDSITWQPTHTIILVTNSLPKADGTDSALFQRVRVVPFEQRFRGTDAEDRSLGVKLKAEADGILAWLIEGYREYEDRGLDEPESVKLATEDYQQDSDDLAEFLAAEFVVTYGEQDWVLSTTMWDEWRQYCRVNRIVTGSKSDLKRKLAERGLPEERVRVDGGRPRAFIGLTKRSLPAPF